MDDPDITRARPLADPISTKSKDVLLHFLSPDQNLLESSWCCCGLSTASNTLVQSRV
jgi:hypothetical protein